VSDLSGSFVSRVMTPLVAGGPVPVGAPLDAGELAELVREPVDTPSRRALFRARREVAAEVTLQPPPLELDAEALALAVALYDALYLSHPAASHHRSRARARVADFAEAAAQLAPPADRDSLVARHTVVHNLFRIARTDRRVAFWVGTRNFRGQEPPRRLTVWPRLRRVRVDTMRINWYRESGVPPAVHRIVRRLCEASPLTDLVCAARNEPPIALAHAVRYLADPEIARFVAYEHLRVGLPPLLTPLGAALGALAAERPGSAELRLAVCYVTHLHVLDAMAAETQPSWLETEAIWPSEEARSFCAAFAAAFAAGILPPGVDDQPGLAERLARRAVLCTRMAGARRVQVLGAELDGIAVEGAGGSGG
jgi:hypothetical protein